MLLRFIYIATQYFFLWLNSAIACSIYLDFFFFLSKWDVCILTTFWLSWIVLSTLMYRCLFESLLMFFLVINLRGTLQDHMVNLSFKFLCACVYGPGDWIYAVEHARQVLYCWATLSVPRRLCFSPDGDGYLCFPSLEGWCCCGISIQFALCLFPGLYLLLCSSLQRPLVFTYSSFLYFVFRGNIVWLGICWVAQVGIGSFCSSCLSFLNLFYFTFIYLKIYYCFAYVARRACGGQLLKSVLFFCHVSSLDQMQVVRLVASIFTW